MRIRYPSQIEARRQVAHAFFGRLLIPIAKQLGYGLRRLRVQPSYGRGWTLFVSLDGVEPTAVIDATRTDVAAFRESETWGFGFAPPASDVDVAAYTAVCVDLCEALAARPAPLPPMLVEVPGQLIRTPVEAVDLTSLCDRGCLFCGVNYRRLFDPAVPSWSAASTGSGRAWVASEALSSWPAVEARLVEIAAGSRSGTLTWRGTDALASPIFERALERAYDLGLRCMDVQTPGTALADPDFVDYLRAHGVESAHLTAHAHSEPLFDFVGGLDGAYRHFWAAVMNLLERGMFVYVEVPCVVPNIEEIPALLEALSRLPVRVSVFYWYPEPEFVAGYDAMPLSLEAAVDVLAAAVPRVPVDLVSVSGVPACAVRPELIAHFRWHTANKHLRSNELGHAASCERCAVRAECVGVPAEYLDHFKLSDPIESRDDPRASLVIDGPRKPARELS